MNLRVTLVVCREAVLVAEIARREAERDAFGTAKTRCDGVLTARGCTVTHV